MGLGSGGTFFPSPLPCLDCLARSERPSPSPPFLPCRSCLSRSKLPLPPSPQCAPRTPPPPPIFRRYAFQLASWSSLLLIVLALCGQEARRGRQHKQALALARARIAAEEEEVGGALTIAAMPDGFLLRLFLGLTASDRVACESVCRRWQGLLHDRPLMWRSLHFVQQGHGSGVGGGREQPPPDARTLRSLVLRSASRAAAAPPPPGTLLLAVVDLRGCCRNAAPGGFSAPPAVASLLAALAGCHRLHTLSVDDAEGADVASALATLRGLTHVRVGTLYGDLPRLHGDAEGAPFSPPRPSLRPRSLPRPPCPSPLWPHDVPVSLGFIHAHHERLAPSPPYPAPPLPRLCPPPPRPGGRSGPPPLCHSACGPARYCLLPPPPRLGLRQAPRGPAGRRHAGPPCRP